MHHLEPPRLLDVRHAGRFLAAAPATSSIWRAVALAAVVALVSAPAAVRADEDLDAGIRFAQEAEFEQALEAFARASSGSGLTRAHLVTLLEQRAVVRFALGDQEAMAEDLRGLAALAPNHVFGPAVPPPVRAAFENARGAVEPVAVLVRVSVVPNGVRLDADVSGGTAAVIREVLVAGRVGNERWEVARGGSVTIPRPAGASVEYYAEVEAPSSPGRGHRSRQKCPDPPEIQSPRRPRRRSSMPTTRTTRMVPCGGSWAEVRPRRGWRSSLQSPLPGVVERVIALRSMDRA